MRIKLTTDVKKSTGAAYFKAGSVIEVSDTYGRRLIAEGKARETIDIVEFTKEIQSRFDAMRVAKIVAKDEEE